MNNDLILVNLLPLEQRPQAGHFWAKLGVLVGMLLITAICVFAAVVVNIMLIQESGGLDRANRQLSALQPQVEEYDELMAEEELLKTRQRIIDELIVNRMEWAPKLALISELLPEDIWLERIYLRRESRRVRVQPTPEQRRAQGSQLRQRTRIVHTDFLNIDAVSHRLMQDTELVARTIESLQKSPEFMADDFEWVEMVWMGHEPYRQRDRDGREVVRFQIECKLAGTTEEESS